MGTIDQSYLFIPDTGRNPDDQIELNEDFVPKRGRIYPLSPKQQNTLDEWIKEHLEKGYIRQSKSPQAAPFFSSKRKINNNYDPVKIIDI